MEKHLVEGRTVLVWRKVLSSEQCDELVAAHFTRETKQEILQRPELAARLLRLVSGAALDFPAARPTGDVTFTSATAPIGWHTDKRMGGSTHKLLVYLNDVPRGGTMFGRRSSPLVVENAKGSVVLFDMALQHASEVHEHCYRKLALGLRLVLA